MKKGDIVKLGPWSGAIVEILTNEDGAKFARVKLVKHRPGITEVHPLDNLRPATRGDIEREHDVIVSAHNRNLSEVYDVIKTTI